MSCECCKRDLEIKAKNLCGACYQRFRSTGSTEYKRKGVFIGCSAAYCKDKTVAQGLCRKHYMRKMRHGHIEDTRPEYWGAKTKHPMWNAYNHIKRFSKKGEVCDSWENDFFQFVIDVGERPSKSHRLYRSDETKKYSKDNFIWKRSFTEKVVGEDEGTYKARRMRAYRKVNSENCKAINIKRKYGLSKEQHEVMKIAHDNLCAICHKKETSIDNNGSKRALAIDHCHETGKVRGLLCTNCNTLIGRAKDSVDVLNSAIQYLEKYSE